MSQRKGDVSHQPAKTEVVTGKQKKKAARWTEGKLNGVLSCESQFCQQDLDSKNSLGLERGLGPSMPDLGHIMVKKKYIYI